MDIERLAFVDVETTGANPVLDRVTEIGIVTVNDGQVSRWSSLVDPGCRIPPFIQALTGITPEMVAGAPTFEQLADTILARLKGYTFVAHNARFDYGFLKNEFKRAGRRFQADVLCTVKLSRALYPQFHKHSLDALIARHDLHVEDRHRALADAELIWQFWQRVRAETGTELLGQAIGRQLVRPVLPEGLDDTVLEDLPDLPGVYLLYGDGDELLHVGRASNLQRSVLSHFGTGTGTRVSRVQRLGRRTRRIEWHETLGELGAFLLEARLSRERRPESGLKRKEADEQCTWQLEQTDSGAVQPRLACGAEWDLAGERECYGLFASRYEALMALRSIAVANGLCLSLLGLVPSEGDDVPCPACEDGRCQESGADPARLARHAARLVTALSGLKLKTWPFDGPIGIVERDEVGDREAVHVVDAWCHLGTAQDEAGLAEILGEGRVPSFDRNIYKQLVKYLAARPRILRLAPWPAGRESETGETTLD